MSCQEAELHEESARVLTPERRIAWRSSQGSKVSQGANTGQKKVPTTYRSDESFERRLLPHRLRRNAVGTAGAKEWVAFGVPHAKHRIQKPGVLNEFELALDLAVQADKNQAAVGTVVLITIGNGVAIDAPAAHDAMAVGGLDNVRRVFRGGGQAVSRICPPNMGGDRTTVS